MDEHEMRPPARPAWVIWLAIVVAILIVTGIVLMVLVPGQHGPGRHL
jgi:hypothetical protein